VYMGDHAVTGANATVMAGSHIGVRSIVGANCCFRGRLPDRSVCFVEANVITRQRSDAG
jgi:acetyltransferase-like isoleucine patch superfamily enzyme